MTTVTSSSFETSQVEKHITRITSNGLLSFWCPGCKELHAVPFASSWPGARWGWNGDRERPTLTPSILTTSGHFCPGFKQGEACWCTYNARNPAVLLSDLPACAEHAPKPEPPFTCGRCHTFVKNGQIEFLSDCTHELAGKTVNMEAF
jgi:hypothetical protein